MSELARRQREAGDAYKAEHPGVDWSTHVVALRRNPDDTWEGIGHQFWSEEDRARLRCCDPDGCPTHRDEDR
jgi:hypothetical protein